MSDPLNDALREAALTVLLGSHQAPVQIYDNQGYATMGMVTVESAFVTRIKEKARKGDFDDLIAQAMAKITPDDVVTVIKDQITAKFLAGLETIPGDRYGGTPKPNWLQDAARKIAVEATTSALSADEALLDTLRAKIGAEVDRNRVGITVSLSDPEKS